jgi:hypothetical protein
MHFAVIALCHNLDRLCKKILKNLLFISFMLSISLHKTHPEFLNNDAEFVWRSKLQNNDAVQLKELKSYHD